MEGAAQDAHSFVWLNVAKQGMKAVESVTLNCAHPVTVRSSGKTSDSLDWQLNSTIILALFPRAYWNKGCKGVLDRSSEHHCLFSSLLSVVPASACPPWQDPSHHSQARQESMLPQGCLLRPGAVPWVGTLHHLAKVTKSTCSDAEMPSYHPYHEGFPDVGRPWESMSSCFPTSLTKLEPGVYLPPSTLWQGPESSLLGEGTPSHKWALFYRRNQVSVEKSLT